MRALLWNRCGIRGRTRTPAEITGICVAIAAALLALYVLSVPVVVRVLHHVDIPTRPGAVLLCRAGGNPLATVLHFDYLSRVRFFFAWVYSPLFVACDSLPWVNAAFNSYLALWGVTTPGP